MAAPAVAQSDIQNATHMTTKGTMEGDHRREREREGDSEGKRGGQKKKAGKDRGGKIERRRRGDDACMRRGRCNNLHDFTNPKDEDDTYVG